MEKLDKAIKYSKLTTIYKELLTHTQAELLEDYYSFDLSYSEIADNRKITRAAVEDAIKKGMKKLDEFESKLHILENSEEILKITAELKEKCTKDDYLKKIEEIERKVNNGI